MLRVGMHFNTSNVTIQRIHIIYYASNSLHFNTSNVTIQPERITQTKEHYAFQYI